MGGGGPAKLPFRSTRTVPSSKRRISGSGWRLLSTKDANFEQLFATFALARFHFHALQVLWALVRKIKLLLPTCIFSSRAMGKSTKSTSSRPSILKNNRKYAGTPMKKPSCTFLRSVLVQTDWTFDNQIPKLSGGPAPPTFASMPITRDVAPTEAPPSATNSGATAQASAMSSPQSPFALLVIQAPFAHVLHLMLKASTVTM